MTSILQNITDHKQSKIAAALQLLGSPDNKPVIHSGNRNTVRGLLNGLGFPTDSYINLSLDDLAKLYASLSVASTLLPFVSLIIAVKPDADITNVDGALSAIRQRVIGAGYPHGSTMPSTEAIVTEMARCRDGNATDEKAFEVPEVKVTKVTQVETTPALPVSAGDVTPDMVAAIGALASLFGSKQQAPAIDEAKIIELVKKHSMATVVNLVTKTGEVKIDTGLHHKELPMVIKMLSANVNVFMVGAAGSGKTTIAEQAAKALGLSFYFNGALDSEYKLTGFVDAQGRCVSTAFKKAYAEGGVYLFDEVDASLPSALLAFNAALANGHADFPDGAIKRHENFKCIAAANTYGKGADRLYVGRNQLDAATLDRFCMVNIDYDEKLEKAITGNDAWVDIVQKVRASVYALKLRHIVSPRASIHGARLLNAGIAERDVMESVVWKGLDKDTIGKIRNHASL